MGAAATFSFTTWQASYPEFSTTVTTSAQALDYFNTATLYFRNDGRGPVQDPTQQLTILNILTAHIAFLAVGTNAGPSAASQGIAGRVTSASQGSVSISTELPAGIDPYFAQSVYGISYWRVTAPFRTMVYRPMCGRRFF